MLESVLPDRISRALNNIPYSNLCELRLRSNNPIIINLLGVNYYLGDNSLVRDKSLALQIGDGVLQSIIQKLSNYSLYSINDQIIEGYISYEGGIRIGICGEVVGVDGLIKTIKNITSINFRFPHKIKNCSLNIYKFLKDSNGIKNTLIISPPGAGKTTILRDLIYQLSNEDDLLNILVVDERQELASVFNGNFVEKLDNVDVYSKCSKGFAFSNGIRSMKPDVIVTDEINLKKDIEDIENALTSGVKVIASIHANDINDLKNKSGFKELLNKKLFQRFVVLSKDNGVGTIDGVFNHNFNLIGV